MIGNNPEKILFSLLRQSNAHRVHCKLHVICINDHSKPKNTEQQLDKPEAPIELSSKNFALSDPQANFLSKKLFLSDR